MILMSDQMWNPSGRIRVFRIPRWQIALAIALALALGIAIAVVATGILLIALPIVAAVTIAYRLFGGRRRRTRGGETVIEGDYEVISADPNRGRNRNDGAR
ncbi:MAG: hypothetical protein KIT16_13125 [Rhodospirillaceae bacterium]|nr:hypothetical protein [Rhodospirillaceae bacterium]